MKCEANKYPEWYKALPNMVKSLWQSNGSSFYKTLSLFFKICLQPYKMYLPSLDNH